MTTILHLPAPPSNNELTRTGKNGKRYKTERYGTWLNAAGWSLKTQRPAPVHGPYRLNIVLDCARRVTTHGKRRKIDVGNFEKAVSDLLVEHDIVSDDSLCEELTIRWGWPQQDGCAVEIHPTNAVALPASHAMREAAE